MPNNHQAAPSLHCVASLEDARLIEEHLASNQSLLATAVAVTTQRVEITAQTTIEDEVAVAYADGRPKTLRIVAKVKVTVDAKDFDQPLANYTSVYLGLFKIQEFAGLSEGQETPIQAVAPYVKQINWLAVRRADGSLAATGIASLRLNVPSVPDQS